MRQRKRAESLLSMDQLKRMEMEKMFNLYDDDGSGEIDSRCSTPMMAARSRWRSLPTA